TLNPEWLEGMKAHGYKGANDIAKRVVRMFGWQATTHEVDDWLFDASVEAFVDDDEMREFFEKNNIYALEELERRLLEAQARGLWNPDPDTLERLKEAYLRIESELEEMAGDGEFQGGSIDMFTQKDVLEWDQRGVSDITSRIHSKKQ
ncbi:MAG: cobaltochelatase subunit CobN, partial [Candidatus Methanomethylophilaceae archaeon]|nr:cobaltochelatase subunit CobN [Candidatus Methanomethylophilaceae archaeon]